MLKLVDVYTDHGDQVGCYMIELPKGDNDELFRRIAIDRAVEEGDAQENERRRLVAFLRKRAPKPATPAASPTRRVSRRQECEARDA